MHTTNTTFLTFISLVLAVVLVPASGRAETADRAPAPTLLNSPNRPIQLALHGEIGFVGVARHTIRFGKDGSTVDYRRDGGQDVLFPFMRFSADATLGSHTLIGLYQPLDLRTRVLLRRDLRIDGATFAAGTTLDSRYGFDFWRLSYLYDLLDGADELGIGVSLQLRNANIEFESGDGSLRRTNRDVGPVPLLKVRGRFQLDDTFWLGGEADGFYAPIKYINGSGSDVEGAILDATVRAGALLRPGLEAYVGVRYLAGGAKGTSQNDEPPGDGFTSNWLHFVSLTLGVSVR